ncbi:hypothetical protein [Thalassotalea eurytherma]|uniref:Phage protein n=1 Tax=Thalassotalea eurytherma TaxID=1144278 RepID=A0ABQ6GZ22_9GAMM|nr:hypothetical protein [Thalassotalea eurytherma]GLX80894.1 hypothetical protein theurythT_03460 [Thalassotalea eurytherma]
MMENQIILLLLSQVIIAIASVGAIKTEIAWIKRTLENLEKRVKFIEQESHCVKHKKPC